jgi:uncharacterized protein YcbX
VSKVGVVNELKRYPVKSFAGEMLHVADVAAYGFVGDRKYAFIDESKEGFERYYTARQIPQMLQYQAEWGGEAEEGQSMVKVTSPEGVIYQWNEALLAEVQQFSMRTISQLTFEPDGAELMAVDNESVLLITDASLRKLEEMWGESLDQRRFRANIIINLLEDTPFIETTWLGKKLQIGDVVLQVNVECERCTMITLDPDLLVKDASILEKLIKERKQNFGVYASIIKPGRIRQGDTIILD